VVCVTLTGLLLAGLRGLYPRETPDVGALIRNPAAFGRAHHAQLAWWSVALVAVATIVAVIAADPRIARRLKRAGTSRPARWLTGSRFAHIKPSPALYELIHLYDQTESGPGPVSVTAQLTDGTLVHGSLHSYDVGTDDEERDFVLAEPSLTTLDGKTHKYGAQFAVISGRTLARLDVTHLAPRVTAAPEPPRGPWRGVLPPDP
jgi:Family of unknown function (DUF6338)